MSLAKAAMQALHPLSSAPETKQQEVAMGKQHGMSRAPSLWPHQRLQVGPSEPFHPSLLLAPANRCVCPRRNGPGHLAAAILPVRVYEESIKIASRCCC